MQRLGVTRRHDDVAKGKIMNANIILATGMAGLALFARSTAAADAPASTAFSSVGRVEFSQGGKLTVGNDILAISTPDYGRQIENTDVPMSVELYAMGQRAAAPSDSAFLQSWRRFARMGAAKGKRP